MTTPQDPGAHPDPTGSSAWSLEKGGAAPAADPAAAQGQWYQDPSGQWWYQDPTGQWYQDPRHAEQSAPNQYDQGAQYPPADQSQPWAGYPQQPAQDQSAYGSYQAQPGYGQPAYGQQYPAATYQSYPGYPSYGTGFGTTPETSNRRPGVVIAAAVLWIVSGVLMAILALIIAIYGGSASDADLIEDLELSVDEFDDIDTIRNALVAGGIVGAVLGTALVLFGVLLLRRKGWSRILTTVIGVILLLPLILTLVGPILVIVAIVLQFLPAANTWFRSRPGAT